MFKVTHELEFYCKVLKGVLSVPAYGVGHAHAIAERNGITYYSISEVVL